MLSIYFVVMQHSLQFLEIPGPWSLHMEKEHSGWYHGHALRAHSGTLEAMEWTQTTCLLAPSAATCLICERVPTLVLLHTSGLTNLEWNFIILKLRIAHEEMLSMHVTVLLWEWRIDCSWCSVYQLVHMCIINSLRCFKRYMWLLWSDQFIFNQHHQKMVPMR